MKYISTLALLFVTGCLCAKPAATSSADISYADGYLYIPDLPANKLYIRQIE